MTAKIQKQNEKFIEKKTIQGKFQCSDQAETVAKLKANQQEPGMTQIRPKHGN